MARHFKNNLTKDLNILTETNGKWDLKSDWKRRLNQSKHKLLENFEAAVGPTSNTTIFTGQAGYSYLYLHLACSIQDKEEKQKLLSKSWAWLRPCLEQLDGRTISFLLGDPGPLALAVVLLHRLGDHLHRDMYLKQLREFHLKALDSKHPDEILYGRSGYLYSCLFVQQFGDPSLIEQPILARTIQAILANGRSYAKATKSEFPLMYQWHRSEYLGPAHGISGIYYILLRCKNFLTQQDLQDIEVSMDILAKYQLPNGNFPSSLPPKDDRLVQWCHGAPGVIHLYLLGAQVFPSRMDEYLQIARRCANCTWDRGLLTKGYGLCHGAAGNAYGFLALHRATQNPEYLCMAAEFGRWCMDYGQHGCSQPDEPLSLYNGLAGTIVFLTDLIYGRSEFPCFGLPQFD